MDKTIRALGERGFYGFTIHELARACGLSNAGLLYHFPPKDYLLHAVLREMQEHETEALMPLITAVSGADARMVLAVFDATIMRSTSRPELGRLYAMLRVEALDRGHSAHRWWQEREDGMLRLFEGLLTPHMDEPATVAVQLAAMLDGLYIRWLRAGACFDMLAKWRGRSDGFCRSSAWRWR